MSSHEKDVKDLKVLSFIQIIGMVIMGYLLVTVYITQSKIMHGLQHMHAEGAGEHVDHTK